MEDLYPRALDKVRISTDHVGFTKIYNTEVKVEEIKMKNVSTELVKLDFDQVPNYVTIQTIPEVLKPDEEGKIVVKYDGTKIDDFGFVINKVMIKENGEVNSKNRLTISANIYEDFSNL